MDRFKRETGQTANQHFTFQSLTNEQTELANDTTVDEKKYVFILRRDT